MSEPKSWASSPEVRRAMRSNRSRDTKPEIAVRQELHRRGMRYRVDFRPFEGDRRTVDVAFTRARVAVLIDGCFWHGCPEHYRAPASNVSYWHNKVRRNSERDVRTTNDLTSEGWVVLRFWEHEDPVWIADQVESSIQLLGR
ncbi:very short patch repair endonuclease [Nocardiopsis dassonvillei]|uniref:very short patch repair endonuclease n=1 Tax=Nocardiopsis dassonvillei TaxID=2014 RepID=UPI0009D976CA|nr:very short patch repair endonuclease [Nocardiopsis dassonvillei]NKY78180.1 very short patch repair endonuclease [Nocardiopsis dassonvillei]